MLGRGGRRLALCAAAGGLLLFPSFAMARLFTYESWKDVEPPEITMNVRGHTNARGLIDEARVMDFQAKKVKFTCPGGSVVDPYGAEDFELPDDGVRVEQDGEFESVVKHSVGTHVVEKLKLNGQFVSGSTNKAKGTFRIQRGEGGIEFPHCDTDLVTWKAKVPLAE